MADIVFRDYQRVRTGTTSCSGVVSGTLTQARVMNNKFITASLDCSETHDGAKCFKDGPSDGWSVEKHKPIWGSDSHTLFAGETTHSYGEYGLDLNFKFEFELGADVVGSLGTLALPGEASNYPIVSGTRGSSNEAFRLLIDKAGSASGNSLEKAVHAIKSKTFDDLDQLLQNF